MNILLLTTRLNIGGIGIYTTSLAAALKRKGHNLIVASSGGRLIDLISREGIEHIYLPIDTSAEVGPHLLKAYLILSRLIRDRGIQIIHAQTRVAQVIAALLSSSSALPYVTTCHGFFKKRFFRRIFPCWGSRVIAISDAVRDHLVDDMGVEKPDISLVYNGIDLSKFSRSDSRHDRDIIRKEYGVTGYPVIGTISRLSEVKGHRYILEAMPGILSQLPGAQLLIIGDGPSDYLDSLKRLSKDLGIAESVIFHPECEDTGAPLSIMDIFCMASLQEGLGLSILEAMAMRLPVVASDVGGINTLIKDRHNGILVPPKDPARIAQALISILQDKQRAAQMGDISRRIVEERFTLDKMAEGVLAVYRDAIAGGKGDHAAKK